MLLERKIPFKYIFNKVKNEVPVVLSFLVVINVVNNYFEVNFELPIAIPAFLGTAITLVLAFKLNQSYDRWWEARKIWGAIVNDSRSLVIQLKSFAGDQNKLVRLISFRQIAWCYSLSNSLRNLNPTEIIIPFIPKDELSDLKNHLNVPLAIIDLNAKDVNTLYSENLLNQFQQVQIDHTLVRLCASMGKAERIKNTIFPKTYRIFSKMFIYIFLFCLTISLTEFPLYIEVLLLIVISLPFFLLEKTAFHMQDPFENRPSDTSMLSISRTIEINIKQLLKEENIPEIVISKDFFDM